MKKKTYRARLFFLSPSLFFSKKRECTSTRHTRAEIPLSFFSKRGSLSPPSRTNIGSSLSLFPMKESERVWICACEKKGKKKRTCPARFFVFSPLFFLKCGVQVSEVTHRNNTALSISSPWKLVRGCGVAYVIESRKHILHGSNQKKCKKRCVLRVFFCVFPSVVFFSNDDYQVSKVTHRNLCPLCLFPMK